MLKLKEEEYQSNDEASNELTEDQIHEQKETLSERCQRIMSARIPERFYKWKNQYRKDVLLSKRLVQISVLYIMQSLAFYLLGWQFSPYRHCLLIFLNSCFLLNRTTLYQQRIEQKLIIWNEIRSFFKSQNIVISLSLLLYGIKLLAFYLENDHKFDTFAQMAMTLLFNTKFAKQSTGYNTTSTIIISTMMLICTTQFIFSEKLLRYQLSTQTATLQIVWFTILSELNGCICTILHLALNRKFYFWDKPAAIHFQIEYSSLTKLYFLSIYSPSAVLFYWIVLLQSSAYWWLRIQFKPYFLLLKESKHLPELGFIVKYRSNQCYRFYADQDYSASQLKILRNHQNFEDELCCMCCKNKINVVNNKCQHAWFCGICHMKQQSKRAHLQMSSYNYIQIKCPQCSSILNKVCLIQDYSPNCILREILNNNWKRFSFLIHFSFIERYTR